MGGSSSSSSKKEQKTTNIDKRIANQSGNVATQGGRVTERTVINNREVSDRVANKAIESNAGVSRNAIQSNADVSRNAIQSNADVSRNAIEESLEFGDATLTEAFDNFQTQIEFADDTQKRGVQLAAGALSFADQESDEAKQAIQRSNQRNREFVKELANQDGQQSDKIFQFGVVAAVIAGAILLSNNFKS